MSTSTELLKLVLQEVNESYDIAVFNQNFSAIEAYAKSIGKTVADVIDASKTFDVWSETKGVSYVSKESTSDGLSTITETLTMSGKMIAKRVNEEQHTGWRITTILYYADKEVSKVATWTETQTGWTGVVS